MVEDTKFELGNFITGVTRFETGNFDGSGYIILKQGILMVGHTKFEPEKFT